VYFTFLVILTGPVAVGQENITLSTAIESTLKNNFFINIARNDEQIAKNDNTVGNAGFLPVVDLVAGISTATNSTEQVYSNGNTVEQDGAKTDNINAAARLSWTLFDGMRMFAAKSRLGVNEEASSLMLKLEIENKIAEVITTYFNIVRIQQAMLVLQETIRIYDDRVQIAETRFTIGSASKLDFLQAKVDRNSRVSELMRLGVEHETAIAALNRLMGKSEFTAITAADSIIIDYEPSLEDLRKSVRSNNTEINLGGKYTEMSDHMIDEVRALRYPWLDANVNYNFNRTENEVGFSLLNKNQGVSAGLTLSWNIFNGFNTGRQIKNAKLNLKSTQLLLADTQSKIEQELYVSFRKFESDKSILKLEESNVISAKENVDVALEAYRLGSISGLQLKEAQNSYEESFSRLIDARYQAKLSETLLMKLNGDLVK
jgi:outer membrane protein TolC